MSLSFNASARSFIAACAAGATLLALQPASAATATSNLSVTATVTKNCGITTTPIAFGNVDVTSGLAVDATGTLSVTCTSGTPWTLSGPGSVATRSMVNGARTLNYNLYSDSSRQTAWADGVGGTGNGLAQTSTLYARIPANQTSVTAGSYSETVVVTVTY